MEGKTLVLQGEADIISARKFAKELAAEIGFDLLGQVQIATIVSELARNAVQYAGKGEIRVAPVLESGRRGLELVCSDQGPGIPDTELALMGGYSTGGGLGRGLSGARALLNDFVLETAVGTGTVVKGRKWLP